MIAAPSSVNENVSPPERLRACSAWLGLSRIGTGSRSDDIGSTVARGRTIAGVMYAITWLPQNLRDQEPALGSRPARPCAAFAMNVRAVRVMRVVDRPQERRP